MKRGWIIFSCVVLGALFMLVSWADSVQHPVYGGAEMSPLSEVYQLWGWNIPRYYYSLFAHLFDEYAWVVRMAYMVIILSCIILLGLVVAMGIDIYKRKRNKKFLNKIREKYLEPLKSVCYAEVENLPTEEIKKRIDYKEKKWDDWQMKLWSELFIELTRFTNTHNPNLTNIQRAMALVGFTDYVEFQLIQGKRKSKLNLLQTVRLTNMQLPNSIVTRLVNDKDPQLRKASRLYYMCNAKDDPYSFFEEESKQKVPFAQWDKMELHEIFRMIKDADRPAPLFVPILQKLQNPNLVSFMLSEIAYWGTDQEMRHVMEYFESNNFEHRNVAFQSMGVRGFSEAEKPMQRLFYKQTEVNRRAILNSVLAIGSGRSITFFRDTYKSAVSDYTKRTALRCLWQSGIKGRAVFEELKAEASPSELILFQHVESPLINSDLWFNNMKDNAPKDKLAAAGKAYYKHHVETPIKNSNAV